MITNGYITLAQFKERLWDSDSSTDAARDSEIERMINGASRWIDNHCGRRFYAATETRTFTAEYTDLLFVDDLISVSTLKTDDDEDRTYETTWTSDDYDLAPENAAYDNPPHPYNMIRVRTDGDYSFPTRVRRGVQVVGEWGWLVTNTALSATLGEDLDDSETDVDVSAGTAFAIGQIIRIDSEDMTVDSISTNTLTVRRGINGTTATTHDNGATVSVREFAPPIVEACWLLSARLYKRKDTIFGVSANTALGQMMVKAPKDDEIYGLLEPFIRSVP